MGDIKPLPAQYFINLMEKILEENRKNQTNERWFCQLPTEEKAKRIINIAVNSNCDYETIVNWLKNHTARKQDDEPK